MHRVFAEIVRHVFGKIEFVLDQWAAKFHTGSHVQQANQMVVLSAERWDHVQELVVPPRSWGPNFNSRQSAGKSAICRAIRRVKDLDGLNGGNGNRDREASRHRI